MKLYQQLLLQDIFSKKKIINHRYSLRSFARDISINASILSRTLNGKCVLSLENALKVAVKLKLTPKESTKFIQNSQFAKNKGTAPLQKVIPLEIQEYRKVIRDWEYYAMLDLMRTSKWHDDISWIARKLEISQQCAIEVMEFLKEKGMVRYNDDVKKFVPEEFYFTTQEDISSEDLKFSHEQSGKMALDKLKDISVELRDYSSLTTPFNIKKLPLIKKIIRKFRQDIAEISQEGDCEEVYQMNIQLFPLTTKLEEK